MCFLMRAYALFSEYDRDAWFTFSHRMEAGLVPTETSVCCSTHPWLGIVKVCTLFAPPKNRCIKFEVVSFTMIELSMSQQKQRLNHAVGTASEQPLPVRIFPIC